MRDGAAARVTILYNAPILPADHPDARAEADVLHVVQAVAEALGAQGFETALVAAQPPADEVLARLRASDPDLVFNLIEGFEGSSVGATLMTALVELAGFACTGCPSESLGWCLAKSRAKALLHGLGLPTARFAVLEPEQPIIPWTGPWPVFVKPDGEDASLGIDQQSVVVDQDALVRQIGRLRRRYGGGILVESYLPGREFNLGVLALPDPEALPVAEVAYIPRPGAWPILSYEAKWVIGSTDDLASPIQCPAAIDDTLAAALSRLALAAFRATGCRDYARVDLRLDEQGQPMLLEVNPNPDISPTAGMARMLRASGRDYAATLAAIARQAIARGPALGAAARARAAAWAGAGVRQHQV
jgi:D-alanine-D-alanine ligase